MTDFLSDLWGDKPENQYILLWTLRTRHSAFFNELQDVRDYAANRSQQDDVYIGVGLRPEALPPDKRGGNQDVSGIAGLWLDIDLKNPVHQKTNLFETPEQALDFIHEISDLDPTYVIHTGHGLHVWWLFTEIWMFDTPEERKSAADLSRKWTHTFRFKAREINIEIDSLFDLSRVMRLPGTVNRKTKQIKSVDVYSYTGERYSPSDFDAFITDTPMSDAADSDTIDVGDFLVNMMAEPNFSMFELLTDNSAKFRMSWQHRRKDLSDNSMSSYDQSLASLAARAGWAPQEIANLLIAHRRKYNETGGKHDFPDYLKRTINFAMKGLDTLGKQAQVIEQIDVQNAPPEVKYDALTRMLGGVQVKAIVKYMSDPPSYRLDTEAGTVSLGQITGLTNQTNFSQHVANATRRALPKMKDVQWQKIVQIMLDLLQEESAGEEATSDGMVRSWLSAFLSDHVPTDSLDDAVRSLSTFIDAGKVFLFGQSLRRYLHISYGDRVDSKELGIALRTFGCVPTLKTLPSSTGGQQQRYCWLIPMDKLGS